MNGADRLRIDGWDHIEFYVGNARQAALFYEKAFGFEPIAKAGLETGSRDCASYVLKQGDIRFVFTSALAPDDEIARHCQLHGDGVKAIALQVPDCEAAMRVLSNRQATVLQGTESRADPDGEVRTGVVKYAGDTVLELFERTGYHGVFAPGYRAVDGGTPSATTGLMEIDHVVINVYLGEMDYWVGWFERVMGFSRLCTFTDKDISTEYSALRSTVMEDGRKIKLPVNEPAKGRRKSQIDEYLEWNRGPGVQHIAMSTSDICRTVRLLRNNGVEFLRVPDAYYVDARQRVGRIDQDYDELRELGILVDRDQDGYLLQIFSQPVQDRPTLFFEAIERHGSRGFGLGNFRALFEALEREQKRRGNL